MVAGPLLHELQNLKVMEHLKGGILIFPADIQHITGMHPRRAQQEHRRIRDVLGKKSKKLTVREYCQAEDLNLEEIIERLNEIR